jgi:hypothetical protein
VFAWSEATVCVSDPGVAETATFSCTVLHLPPYRRWLQRLTHTPAWEGALAVAPAMRAFATARRVSSAQRVPTCPAPINVGATEAVMVAFVAVKLVGLARSVKYCLLEASRERTLGLSTKVQPPSVPPPQLSRGLENKFCRPKDWLTWHRQANPSSIPTFSKGYAKPFLWQSFHLQRRKLWRRRQQRERK